MASNYFKTKKRLASLVNMKERRSKGLSYKVLSTLAMTGFVLAPWSAQTASAEIVRDNGTKFNAPVNNIYAEKVQGDNAVNRFQKFELPANQIANMYFRENPSSADAKNLFNFVNSQINIAGTVNAVQNNKVGGNLYFFSKEGMVVSGTGVINAGSLTAMSGVKYPGSMDDAFKAVGNIQNMKYSDVLEAGNTGEIKIEGTINAVDFVSLKSDYKLNVGATGKINTNSSVDFAQYVNIGSGASKINSGLDTSNLVLQRESGNGNIVLMSEANDYNEKASAIDGWMSTATKNNVVAKVELENGSEINSDGQVSIAANAINASGFGNLATFGIIGQTTAEVKLNGTINADKITASANSDNSYVQSATEKIVETVKDISSHVFLSQIFGDSLVKFDIDIQALKGQSDIIVGSDAKLTASGVDTLKDGKLAGALNIAASSSVKEQMANTADSSSKEDKKALAASLIYSYYESNANVTINNGAQLKTTNAKGSVNIASKAASDIDTGANVGQKSPEAIYSADMNLAFNIARGTTNAAIALDEGASINSGMDAILKANVEEKLNVRSAIAATQNSVLNTAILYSDVESEAKLDIKGEIEAEKDIVLNAENKDNLLVKATNAENKLGDSTWIGKLANPSGGDFTGPVYALVARLNMDSNPLDSKWGKFKKFIVGPGESAIQAGKIAVGATVGISESTNKANINIANTATLNAKNGDLKLNAKQYYDDYRFYVTGSANGGNDKLVSVAIGIGTQNDEANINVAGGTADDHAVLKAEKGNVKLNAESDYVWNRFEKMQGALKKALDAITFTDIRKAKEAGAKVPEDIEDYVNAPTAEKYAAIEKKIQNDPTFMSWITDGVVKAVFGLGQLWRAADGYANATSYTNVNVGTIARPKVNDRPNDAKASIAVSAGYTSFNHKANIVLGTNAEVKAGKDVELAAVAKQVDVNYYGSVHGLGGSIFEGKDWAKYVFNKLELDAKILPSWSRSDGDVYGGNVGITDNTINSKVIVAEGAKLEGNNVDIKADTDLQRVLVTLGGGNAAETGATGMVSYHTGETNSIVSVDDEASIVAKGDKGLALNADNDSFLLTVNGDVTAGSAQAIGVAGGFVHNDVNTIAGISDNDKETLNKTDGDDKDIHKAIKAGLSADQLGYLGSVNAKPETEGFSVSKLSAQATSSPTIFSVGAAGAVSKKPANDQLRANPGDVLEQINDIGALLEEDDINNNALNEANRPNNEQVNAPDNEEQAQNPVAQGQGAFKNIIGAGAVEINKYTGVTASLLDGAKVTFTNGARSLDLYAYDDAMAVTVSGALALKLGAKPGAASTIMVAGTSAVNDFDLTALSRIKGSTINEAVSLTNEAKQEEMVVATAAPVSIDASGGQEESKGFSTALNASVNLVDNKTKAVMENNTVSMKRQEAGASGGIQNIAANNSTQITGGLSIDAAKTSGLGINAVVANLHNDVLASVKGGSYLYTKSFENVAAANMTQINAALGIGIGLDDGGTKTVTVGALWSQSKTRDEVKATIDGLTLTADYVVNKAFDGKVENDKETYVAKDEVEAKKKLVKSLGLDVDGSEFKSAMSSNEELDLNTDNVDKNVDSSKKYEAGAELDSEASEENIYEHKKLTFDEQKKTLIINGGLLVSATLAPSSKAVGGVAVVDALVDNTYKAEIANADVIATTAKGVVNQAVNENQIVAAAAGISFSTTEASVFAGAGSAAATSVKLNTEAVIRDSEVNSQNISIKAENDADAVSFAGAFGLSDSKGGVGLAVAVNNLDGTTKASALGATLQGYDSGITAIDIEATNKSDIKAISAGIAFTGADAKVGALGNVAVNYGHNDTIAEIEQTYNIDEKTKQKTLKNSSNMKNAESVKVNAKDKSTLAAAAAGLNIGGAKGEAGFAFAVNKLKDQNLSASLKNTNVTAAKGAKLDVSTDEKMVLKTIAVGGTFAAGDQNVAALNGTAAITLTENKINTAEVVGTTIKAKKTGEEAASLNVKAKEDNEITATSDTLTVGLAPNSKFTLGAAASGINLGSTTVAQVKDSTVNADDVEVNSYGKQKIYHVAAGVGASGGTVNAAGSLGINILKDDVKAQIENSTVNSKGTVAVLAKGEDTLVNVDGGFHLGLGSTLGVGVSVGYNTLSGDVEATVNNSTIKALGNTEKTAAAHEYTTNENNEMTLAETKHKGLVVDAYSYHDVTDAVLNGGITAALTEKGVAVELNGMGAHTDITGATKAHLTNSKVNTVLKKGESYAGDAVVTAYEKTTIYDMAVNVGVAGGSTVGVGVGIGVAMSDINRTTEAVTSDSTVNAKKLVDTAGAKVYDNMVAEGVTAGIAGTAGVGVGATAEVLESTSTINAKIKNVTSTNEGVTLKAAHDNYLDYSAVGITVGASAEGAAAIGATVGVMKETNTINGTLENVHVTHTTENAKDELAVTNYSKSRPTLANVTISGGTGSGSIDMTIDSHSIEDELTLEVLNSDLGLGKAAKEITAKVDNHYDIKENSINTALAISLGGSLGISAQPVTINSKELLDVDNSKLLAVNDVNLKVNELRKIDMSNMNIDASSIIGAGVTNTSVTLGGKLKDEVKPEGAGDQNDNFAVKNYAYITTAETAAKDGKNLFADGLTGTLSKPNGNKTIKDAEANLDVTMADANKPQAISDTISKEKAKLEAKEIEISTGKEHVEGAVLQLANATIDTKGNVYLNNTIKDDIDLYAATGTFGIGSVAVNMAHLTETVNNSIDIIGGSISAKNLVVEAKTTGEAKVKARIASIGGIAVNVGYATAEIKGNGTNVSVDGSTINADASALVRALHDNEYYTYTDSYTLNIASGGYQEAKTEDKLTTSTSVKNSTLNINASNFNPAKEQAHTNIQDWSKATAAAGAVEISAIKASNAISNSQYGGVSALIGNGNTNNSIITGSSLVTFSGNTVKDTSSTKLNEGGVVDIYSRYAAKADVDMNFLSVGVVGSGGGVLGEAKSEGGAIVNVTGNSFDLAALKAEAAVEGLGDSHKLVDVEVDAINVALGVGAGNNRAYGTIDTKAETTLQNNMFATRAVKVNTGIDHYERITVEDEQGNTYEDYVPVYKTETVARGKTDVVANATTNAKAEADVFAVTVGAVVAVGHNKGSINAAESTTVTMDNSGLKDKDNKKLQTVLKSLSLNANGTNAILNNVDGRGGGAVNISPYAATAYNTSTIINKAVLQGKYKLEENLQVSALQTDNVGIHANTESGGVVDVAGVEVENTRTKDSVTKVSLENAQIEAESANISAKNVMNLNKPGSFDITGGDHDDQYAVTGGSGGVFDHSYKLSFTNTLDEIANITVDSASSLTTEKEMALEAATKNSVYVKSRFVNGGLTASNQVYATNNFTYSDTIDIAGQLATNSALGSIDINSVDDTNLQVGAYSTVRGVVGVGSLPETNNTTVRTNKVDVTGKGSVYSSGSLNVNAGQYSNITMAGLNAIIDVQAFSAALIPHNGNKLTNSITEYNIVNVEQGAKLSSIADTNIYANEGATKIDVSNISTNGYGQNWTKTKGYIASDSKSDSAGDVQLSSTNKVVINGTVEAGTKHNLEITIGKAGDVVVIDAEKRELFNASIKDKTAKDTKNLVTIVGDTDNSIENAIAYKSINIVSELYGQYQEQKKVIADYSYNKDSEAYIVAVAKLAALEAQLKQMGFSVSSKTDDGKIVETINASVTTDAIVLPDIYASGGDINIQSDTLQGSGSITANGTPSVKITNNTNLYMVLNDIQVGESGGRVTYNKVALEKGDADALEANKKTIIDNNKDKTGVKFGKLHAEAGEAGVIDIESKYDVPDSFNIEVPDEEGNKVIETVKVLNNIELAKGHAIVNKSGDITIHSVHGDLLLNGSVNGKNNYIKADKGSLYQNTLEGVWNVGGDVEQQYDGLFKQYIADENKYLSGKDGDAHRTGSVKDNTEYKTDDAAGNIMGSNVFIAADTVNINGLVQSGYEQYKVEVGQADVAAIEKLNKTYSGKNYADDDIINMGTASEFCVVKGGQVYDKENGYYYYQVPVYYNPTTKKLLVTKVEDYGGTVYIAGKIASTGNGRIVAMDGTYDINAVNGTNYDLKLYGLSSTTAEGKITIVDTQKKQQTEITRNGYTITDLVKGESDDYSGALTSYEPAKNLRYSWSYGKDSATRTYYEHKLEQTWWGHYNAKDDIIKAGQQTRTSDLKAQAKENNGTGFSEMTGHTSNFEVSFDKVNTSESVSDITETRWTTGLYGYRKHQLFKWYKDVGQSTTYTASVDASKNIGIKFIGNDSGYSNINVSSVGSVDVHGNIGNTSLKSTVSITSTSGGIYQDKGNIQGDKIVLNSVGSMDGINVVGTNVIDLTATNNAKADTVYWRNGVSSTVSDGNEIIINVETQQLKNKDSIDFGTVNLVGRNGHAEGNTKLVGEFNLTANGSIVQKEAVPTAVTASKVSLNAVNGSIGTADKAVLVNTADMPLNSTDTLSASLNAAAKGNIYLQEESGDLRIGTIYSDEGDVSLSGPANLVDALPYAKGTDSRSEEEVVELWKSLGLLDDKTIQRYTYEKNDKPAPGEEINYITTDAQGNKHYFIRTVDGVDSKGLVKFKDVEYDIAKLIVEPASENKAERYFIQKVDPEGKPLYIDTYVSQGQDVNRLLYSVSTGIINPHPGAKLPEKVANIKAKNLTLAMGDSAGLNSDKITEYKISELGFKYADFKDLKDIARADATNVTWNEENDKVTIRERLPIGVKLTGNLYVGAGQTNEQNNADANIEGNVYVEGRNDSDPTKVYEGDINIGNIKAKGDILLKNAFGSILNGSGSELQPVITGANLIFSVGPENGLNGSFGTSGSFMPVNITDSVRGTANAGVYLSQVTANDLRLQNMSTKGDIYLTALGNIVSDKSLNEKSYLALETEGHVISLESVTGNVGTDKEMLRVLNGTALKDEDAANPEFELKNNKALKVKAAKDVYIKGMSNSDLVETPAGTLYVNNITVGDHNSINLDVNGSIFFDDVAADTINAKAALNVTERDGLSSIKADNLTVEAQKGISLRSSNNELHNVELYNAGAYGDTNQPSLLVNGGSEELKLLAVAKSKEAGQEKFAGSLLVDNKAQGAVNDVVLQGQALVEKDFTISNSEASIYVGDKAQYKGFATEAAAIEDAKAIDAKNVSLVADNKVINMRAIEAQGDITLSGKGVTAAIASNVVEAKNVGVHNLSNITTNNGNISLESAEGAVWNGMLSGTAAGKNSVRVEKSGNISFEAAGNVINNSSVLIDGSGDINMLSKTNGSVYSFGDGILRTNVGNIDLRAKAEETSVYIKGNESSIDDLRELNKDSLNYVAETKVVGSVFNEATAIANGFTLNIVSEHGSVFNYNDFSDNQLDYSTSDLVISAANGLVHNAIDLKSDAHITLTAKDGLESFSYNIYGKKGVTLEATDGNVTNSAVLEADAGDIILEAVNGNVTNISGADIITAGGNVKLHAKGDVVNYGNTLADYNPDVKDSGNVVLKSDAGDVYNYFDFKNKSGSNAKYYSDAGQTYYRLGAKDIMVAANDLTLSAMQGSVYNDKQLLEAKRDVTLEAKNGMSNFAYDVHAGRNITLTAADGLLVNNAKLVADSGIVKLEAKNGSVVNMLHGDIVAQEGSVAMLAGAEHQEQLKLVDTKGELVDITIKAVDSNAIATGLKIEANEGKEGINYNDTILVDKYYNNGSGYVRVDENTNLLALTEEQKASLVTIFYQVDDASNTKKLVTDFTTTSAKASFTLEGKTYTGVAGDVEAFRIGDIINRGNIVAGGGTAAFKAENGNIINYDNFEKFNGQNNQDGLNTAGIGAPKEINAAYGVSFAAGRKFYNNMDIASGKDLTISSEGDIVSGQKYNHLYTVGKLTIESTGGSINNSAELVAGDGVVLRAYKGLINKNDITTGGVIELLAGGVDNKGGLNTDTANLYNSGGLNAGSHVRVETNIGDVTLENVDITAKNKAGAVAGEELGYINIATQKGDIKIDHDAKREHTYKLIQNSEDSITIQSGNGDVYMMSEIVAAKNITINADGEGNIDLVTINMQAGSFAEDTAHEGFIKNNGTSDSGKITLSAGGYIDSSGKFMAADAVAMDAENDYVNIMGSITGGNSVTLDAKSSIVLDASIKAQNSIGLGKVDNNGKAVTDNINVNQGALRNITGDIKVQGKNIVSISESDIEAQGGNVLIKSYEKGNAELLDVDLKAAGDAELLANEGNIRVIHSNEYSTKELAVNAGGKVDLKTNKGDILVAKGDITATGNVTLDTLMGNINNNSSINSDGAIEIKTHGAFIDENSQEHSGYINNEGKLTAHSDVADKNNHVSIEGYDYAYNSGYIVADDNVTITSKNGSVGNEADINSGGAVTLNAKGHVSNFGGAVSAENNITFVAGASVVNRSAHLTSSQGSVVLESTIEGSVTNLYSNITAMNGNITLRAEKGDILNVENLNSLSALGDVELVTRKGNITNALDINSEQGHVKLNTAEGTVTNAGMLTATGEGADNAYVELRGTGDVKNTNAIKAKGQVDLVSVTDGKVTNEADITSGNGAANLVGNGEVVNKGAVQAAGSVAIGAMAADTVLVSGNPSAGLIAGSVENSAGITSTKGNISLVANNKVENIAANLTANNNVTLESKVKGNVVNDNSTLKANNGKIALVANEGDVNNNVEQSHELSLQAKDDISLTTHKGSVYNEGGAETTAGAITLITAAGDVANRGSLTAQNDVTVQGTSNVTNILADIESKVGKVNLATEEGVLTNIQSDIKAEEEIRLSTNKGNIINNSSDLNAKNDDVTIQASEAGDIYNTNSAVSAGDNITFSSGKGNIENLGSGLKANSNVELKAINGGNIVNVNSGIEAGNNVELNAVKGDLTNVNSGIVATDGYVMLEGAGEVGNFDSAINAKTNVDIKSTAAGDVDNENSAITTQNGAVTISAATGAVNNLWSSIDVSNKGNVAISATKSIINANSAITTADGDVAIVSASADHGEIYLVDSNIEAGKAVKDTKAVIKAENGNVIMTNSGILAGSSIEIESKNGDVRDISYRDVVLDTQYGEDFEAQHGGITIKAANNVELTSIKGNIVNFGDITATAENADLTAYDGYIVNYANISAAGGEVTMMAYNPSGEAMNEKVISGESFADAKKGDVRSINATYGNESHNTEITAGAGVTIYADSYIQNESNTATADGNIDITSVNSSVTLGEAASGAAPAKYQITGEGNVNVTAQKDVTNKTSVKIGSIKFAGDTQDSGSGNINVTSKTGDIENLAGAEFVTAHGNVTMIADQNITNEGESFARGGEIYLEAVHGDLNNTDDFNTYKGNITDMATSDITLMAAEGKLSNEHNLVSGGNVTLVAKEGLANLSHYITAVGDVNLTATDGNILNQTAILSQNGSIKMTAQKGSITNKAGENISDVLVYDAATDNFERRTVNMKQGDLFALGGDVILHAGGAAVNGDVINEGSIVALGSHKVDDKGTIKNIAFAGSEDGALGNRFFDAGSVTMISDHGNVVNSDASYNADGKRNSDSSNFAIGANNYALALGDIALQATEGSVTNNFNIDAGGNFTAIAKDDVVFGSKNSGLRNGENTFVVTSVGGDLGITSITGKVDTKDFDMTVNGNILMEGYEGVKANSDIKSVLGSIIIASAKGNIYSEVDPDKEYKVEALLGTVALGVGTKATGDEEINLNVDHVTGNNVVLYAPKGNIDANKISAVNNVVTEGKSVHVAELENLNQEGKAIIQAIQAEHYNANYKGDVHFSYFNVGDGNINVGGKAAFDLLKVERDLHINAMGNTVSIYGKSAKPYHDNSAAIFYDPGLGSGSMDRPIVDMSDLFNFDGPHDIDTFKDRFKHIANIMTEFDRRIAEMEKGGTWHTDIKGWMNLYIDGPDYLRSNGTLLHIKNGYYAADQRYALDDLSTVLTSHTTFDLYDYYYNNPLRNDYWRTYLIEDEDEEGAKKEVVFHE